MADVHRSHVQEQLGGGNNPLEVDPNLAEARYAGMKRKLSDPNIPDEASRASPHARLSLQQDAAQAHGYPPPGMHPPPHGPPGHNIASPTTPTRRVAYPQGVSASPMSDAANKSTDSTSVRKVTIACENCRARKTRCDGGIPCGRCVRSNSDCQYDTERRRRGPHAGSRKTKTGPYSIEDFLESNVARAAAEATTQAKWSGPRSRPAQPTPGASGSNAVQHPQMASPYEAGISVSPYDSGVAVAGYASSMSPPKIAKSIKAAAASTSEGEAGPTKTKVTFACQGCRQRKTRCDGVSPCASCARLKVECLYDTERKRRGPRVGYRRGGKAEAVAAAIMLTQPLVDALKNHQNEAPVIYAQPTEIVRALSPEPPPPQFVPGPSLANLVDAARMGGAPPKLPAQQQHQGEGENEDELQSASDEADEEEVADEIEPDGTVRVGGSGGEGSGGGGGGEGAEAGGAAGQGQAGTEPPRRTVGSCAMCRIRKVRCDRVHPQCGSCAQHGQICRYELPPKRRSRKPKLGGSDGEGASNGGPLGPGGIPVPVLPMPHMVVGGPVGGPAMGMPPPPPPPPHHPNNMSMPASMAPRPEWAGPEQGGPPPPILNGQVAP